MKGDTQGMPPSPGRRFQVAEALEPSPIRIGVSACVLGQQVRWDGGHKLNFFVLDTLGPSVELVSVCPEVEMGLGTPRAPLRLVARSKGETPRLVTPSTGADHTERMHAYSQRKLAELRKLDLCGFVVQRGSPTCGMERVRIYPQQGASAPNTNPPHVGRGVFTTELMREFPHLPVEEDGRLSDTLLREHFVERVLAYGRLRDLFASDWSAGDLVAFHSREKLLVLAHSDYRPLGRLVARGKDYPREEWGRRYRELFLNALAKPATVKRHVNVLQHVAGYFRPGLDATSRGEVAELIEAYRLKLVPLVVPLTLMRHHARKLGLQYLNVQSYLHGHPRELLPLNHLDG